jgi:hypothetical protein
MTSPSFGPVRAEVLDGDTAPVAADLARIPEVAPAMVL